ncbi:MAG: hypothetical protein JSU03_04525 [Bacteroidetes bacterium]|nr:hypothetical protein [Bacteroidota bacterium]MBS1756520.1 hypothetical protein [Bacteroidota bacterium]
MPSKRILLVHLYSNGDCLFATTIAKQIKADQPDAYLIWAIGSHCKSIIHNNPFVDEIIEVPFSVNDDKEKIFYNFLSQAQKMEADELVDKVIVSQIIGDNFCNYDSCVRTSIYRCFDKAITVDKTPVLNLTGDEQDKAKAFVVSNNLATYKNVILFECAPLSGQIKITNEAINAIATGLVQNRSDTAIVLSSANKININLPGVFDGSELSIRETAALSHYCTLLLGCSSGITWATTSTGAKQLPMVQLLNKDAYIFNPPSIAFEKVGSPTDTIIELFEFDVKKVLSCIEMIFTQDFATARLTFHQQAKKQFRVFRGITHRFLAQKKYGLLKKFIKMNIAVNGYNGAMLLMILKGIVFYPVQRLLEKKK